LCGSGELFVKAIETFPACALSDFVSYSSCPCLFASRLRLLEAVAGAALVDVAELVLGEAVVAELVVGCVAELDDELELELPQPASTTIALSSANAAVEKLHRDGCPAGLCVTRPP